MNITGNWTLFWDWGSTGNYQSTAMTVNAGGTFSIPAFAESGTWVQTAGMFMFQFDGRNSSKGCTYAGNWVDRVVVGISSTFTGGNGSFYMIETSIHLAHAELLVKGAKNPAGI